MKSTTAVHNDRGVALVLVLFIIALSSILVISLAFSTNLGARISAHVQRSTKAEYLLKSALNFARVLIREDKTPEDSAKDTWGLFVNGMVVPPQLLDINEPNIAIELEIRPEESKIPLAALVPSGSSQPNADWQQTIQRLFVKLGFDSDNEEDQSGFFPNKVFNSEELVAILIDYMDADKASFQPGGIEADIPDETFPNQQIKRLSELSAIPGFTPARIRKLTPFVSAISDPGANSPRIINTININVAAPLVISVMHADMTDDMAQQIATFRNSDQGPFKSQNYAAELTSITGDQNMVNQMASRIREKSRWFQVIAKVSYGTTSTYFLRAYLVRDNVSDLPEIQSIEFF